jgi:hypothetical protein
VTKEQKTKESKELDRTYSILVIELGDIVPRRDQNKQNLHVIKTISSPEERFKQILRGKGSKKIKGDVHRLRDDLSIQTLTTDSAEASAIKKTLIEQLISEGYIVNGKNSVKEKKIWTVYVIELDPTELKDPGRGYVYVGQTYRTPEVRFEQHMSKARSKNGKMNLSSKYVAKHGLGLRMDLAPQKRFIDSKSAKQAEAECAEHLRSLGYVVEGGH